MNKMNKHTTGPWLLDQTTVYALNDERIPVNRFTASVDSGWMNNKERIHREEVFANAQLMAAAPELLEALELLLDGQHCRITMLQGGIGSGPLPTDKARAAIAKAKGESA